MAAGFSFSLLNIAVKPMAICKLLDIFVFSEVTPFLFSLPADSEIIPPDCLRPRSFTAIRRPSLRRETEDTRLSVSLCDLNLQEETFHVTATTCPIPQNSLNSQHSHLLPSQLESDLRFHHLRGPHVKILDDQTVARLEHAREERTLVFTNRPLRINETIFVKINKSNAVRTGTLSYGVTSCDPSTLRPGDLPYNPESLVDRKEFWAICRVVVPLQSGDILGFMVNSDGELHLSHNGAGTGMQVCVDCSQPLWMFFVLHGAVTQVRLLGMSEPPFYQTTCTRQQEGDTLQVKGRGNEWLPPCSRIRCRFCFYRRRKTKYKVMYTAHGVTRLTSLHFSSILHVMASKPFSDNELSLRDVH